MNDWSSQGARRVSPITIVWLLVIACILLGLAFSKNSPVPNPQPSKTIHTGVPRG